MASNRPRPVTLADLVDLADECGYKPGNVVVAIVTDSTEFPYKIETITSDALVLEPDEIPGQGHLVLGVGW